MRWGRQNSVVRAKGLELDGEAQGWDGETTRRCHGREVLPPPVRGRGGRRTGRKAAKQGEGAGEEMEVRQNVPARRRHTEEDGRWSTCSSKQPRRRLRAGLPSECAVASLAALVVARISCSSATYRAEDEPALLRPARF
jgi:hypothetical protein